MSKEKEKRTEQKSIKTEMLLGAYDYAKERADDAIAKMEKVEASESVLAELIKMDRAALIGEILNLRTKLVKSEYEAAMVEYQDAQEAIF